MSSTTQPPAGPRCAADVSMTVSSAASQAGPSAGSIAASMRGYLVSDLEWFWPSRRGHAYDEFCR